MSKRLRFEKFRIDEISGVDRPAQVGARAVIMKRADGDGSNAVEKNIRLTSMVDGHQHHISDFEAAGSTSHDASSDAEFGHSHRYVRNDDGTISIGFADGHTHEVIMKSASVPAGNSKFDKGEPMSQTQGTGENQTKPEDIEKRFASMEAELVLAKAYGALTDAEKEHANTLTEGDERNAFINKSAAERAEVIEKAKGSNPVVYEADNGETFYKNDDARLVKMAKERDEEARERAIEKAALKRERLEKSANSDLPNLKGDVDTKIDLLDCISKLDDDRRGKVMEMLKSASNVTGSALSTLGTEQIGDSATDAEEQLNKRAQELAQKEGIPFGKAFRTVLETPEGRELYKQTR